MLGNIIWAWFDQVISFELVSQQAVWFDQAAGVSRQLTHLMQLWNSDWSGWSRVLL